jgi:hypothetical protein
MNSRPSPRALFTALSLVTALASSGCIADGSGDFEQNDAENVSASRDEIINGTSVTAQYPEAAMIDGTGGTVPSGYFHPCSGTLIAPKVILTAGQCVDGPTTWHVQVGAQVRTSVRAATYDWKNETFANPAHHDIGLVFLDQAITLGSYPTIAPVATPTNSVVTQVGRVHNGLTTTAWGATTNNLAYGSLTGYPFDYTTSLTGELSDAGGPVFLLNTHAIIAVDSGATTISEYIARVDLLNQWITRPIDDSAFFVRQVYLDVLKREPDSAGLAYFVNALNACNGASACLASTRVSVALGLLKSPENIAQDPELNPASAGYSSSFVTHCYTNFLRRQPSAAELSWWVGVFNSSGDSTVVGGFITSPEYRQRFGAQ